LEGKPYEYHDNSLQLLLDSAEGYVRSLCIPFVDSDGDPDTLPEQLQAAVLLLCCHWYDRRGVVSDRGQAHQTELPYSVSALLASFRG